MREVYFRDRFYVSVVVYALGSYIGLHALPVVKVTAQEN